MAQKYNRKAKDSFNAKKKIFLYYLSLNHQLKENNSNKIQELFESFKLENNLSTVHSYQSIYYQKGHEAKINNDKTINEIWKEMKAWEENNIATSEKLWKYYLKVQFPKIFPKIEFEKILKNEKCGYCGISKKEINSLRENHMLLNKHETRGYSFEIDRKEPNLEYSTENCLMSCFWCNNAKTDEFNEKEFKIIATSIEEVWEKRLSNIKWKNSEENLYIKRIIKKKEDSFFKKESSTHKNFTLFKEIFDLLEEPNFKKNHPLQYQREIKRIRDLHNTMRTTLNK